MIPTSPSAQRDLVAGQTNRVTHARPLTVARGLSGLDSGPFQAAIAEPEDPLELAVFRTALVSHRLKPTARRIYQALLAVALHVKRRRGYVASVSRVTFHAPAEAVAHALGVHRTTVWRHLPALREMGLIDSRAHKTDLRGETRNDGTLWCIRLHPTEGRAPTLTHEELKHPWRNLEGDIRAERTAYRLSRGGKEMASDTVQQSKTTKDLSASIEEILDWALPPHYSETPLLLTVAEGHRLDLETVLDLPYCDFEDRNTMVGLAAAACVQALGAEHVQFYHWLMWQLLRLNDQGQDYFEIVYRLLQRARTDRTEGFAENASKLFASRLKKTDYWELIKSTPAVRVAPKPGRSN